MGEYGTGAKSGLVAGLVYGIISGIIAAVGITLAKSEIIATLNKYIANYPTLVSAGITANSLYSAILILLPVISIIVGLIGGAILGLIFAWAVGKLPGRNDKVKGIIFGMILWILFDVLFGLGSITEYGSLYYIVDIAGGFVGALAFGYVIGILYGKWSLQPINDDLIGPGMSN